MARKKKKELIKQLSDFSQRRFKIYFYLMKHLNKDNELISYVFKNKQELKYKLMNKYNLSFSQVKKIIITYLNTDESDEGLIEFINHKNTKQIPWNKITEKDKEIILNEWQKYYDTAIDVDQNNQEYIIAFTLKYFVYDTKLKYTYDTIRRVLLENGVCSHFAHKSTKAKIKKKSNKIKNENKLKEIISLIEYSLKKHRKKCKKPCLFGEILEVDGCDHLWIPSLNKSFNILAIVDRATGMMLAASLDDYETNYNYINVFSDVVEKYGLPIKIHGDRRKSIWSDGISNTKVVKPLVDLGVVIDCQSFPEHKPVVEGMWNTLQKWLPNVLHRKQIKTKESFEKFVKEELCDLYNEFYKKNYDYHTSQFRRIDPVIFKNHFCVAETRKIQKGNYIQINNECVAPFNEKNQRCFMKVGGYINVYTDLRDMKKSFIRFGSERFYLKPIDKSREVIPENLYNFKDPIDETYEIIYDLRDQVASLENQLNELKNKCYQQGVSID